MAKLETLFRSQRGECHWCGVKCQLPTPDVAQGTRKPWPTMATLDHIFDRHHPLRDKQEYEYQLHVMACRDCNSKHVLRRHSQPARDQILG